MTLGEYLRICQHKLTQNSIESAALDARLLVQHALHLSHENLLLTKNTPLSVAQIAAIDNQITRRLNHEPVSRIVGQRAFWKSLFSISPDTLDPRPDSETLIEATLEVIKDTTRPLSILDLGTGSGCLLLSLLLEYPQAIGIGVDKEHNAIAVAQQNASDLNLSKRASFRTGNWTDTLTEKFDLVISNPPYIPDSTIQHLAPDVHKFDPPSALKGGEDGLDSYRAIASTLRSVLKPTATLILEIGQGQHAAVEEIFTEQAGLVLTNTHSDLSGTSRCMIFILPPDTIHRM